MVSYVNEKIYKGKGKSWSMPQYSRKALILVAYPKGVWRSQEDISFDLGCSPQRVSQLFIAMQIPKIAKSTRRMLK